MLNKPNFFILGAAKSGTTSLYYYLKQHPEIYMSPVKEPTFFKRGFMVVDNPIDYFSLFDGVSSETIIGEASHAYLSHPSTAKLLKTLFPDAKFLLILRHPADRAYSLYHHMRRRGHEYLNSFEKGLAAESERFNSERFERRCPQDIWNFYYYRSGLYGEQVARYFALFGSERFYILTLNQFLQDQDGHLKKIFHFLEVDPTFKPMVEPKNQGKVTARFPILHYWWAVKLKQGSYLQKGLRKPMYRLNRVPIPPINPETRQALMLKYREDLSLLESLTGIRLADFAA